MYCMRGVPTSAFLFESHQADFLPSPGVIPHLPTNQVILQYEVPRMPVNATDMYMFAHPIDGMTHGIGFQSAQRNGDRVIKQLTRNFGFGLECFVKDVSQPFSNQLIDDKGVFLDNFQTRGAVETTAKVAWYLCLRRRPQSCLRALEAGDGACSRP